MPLTYGNAAAPYDMGNFQNPYTIYSTDCGQGRTVVAAAAAAEAAATAAAAAVAAANAAQEAAYAANAVTGNSCTGVTNTNGFTNTNMNGFTSMSGFNNSNQNFGKQVHPPPFPARRRKLRPDDIWRKMPHQEGWRSYAWDNNRARSRKRQSDGYGADGHSLSKTRRMSKQRPHYHTQPQQQWRVRRNGYGYSAAEAGGHRTKAKDGQPRRTGYAGASGGKGNPAQHSSGDRKKNAAAEILKLLEQSVSVSTQTLSDEAKDTQTELNLDEVVTTFSLSACDSDDDEADFFPSTDPGSA